MTRGAPLRIVMVSARYFPAGGGTELHTREVARRVAAAGHEVTVLTTDPTGQLPRREIAEGVHIRRVHPAWNASADLHFAPGIFHTIRRGNWDVVHCQGYHTLVPPLAMLGALQAHIPYVLTFHGGGHSSRLRNSIRGAQRAMLRPLLARSARLVALADFELVLFGDRLGIPRQHFVTIPTGADLPKVAAGAPLGSAAPIIASVGRLERYKGHHRLIAALPLILRQQPDARVWIAGAGPYEDALRQLAQRLGVADRVDIHSVPATDRTAMATELSKVALIVLLSEYETQPAAVLEGLALGRPALVADTSGLSELARQGLARAIPLESSPDQVAAAVLAQLRDPLLPTGDLHLPTWEKCTADLIALYQEIVRRPACAS
jgi:glycosyltransferase involved in cell wall biosynthesis